ncbi:MAG: hypothetical protein WBR29_08605 [Gammaproteobacteria bacterium]
MDIIIPGLIFCGLFIVCAFAVCKFGQGLADRRWKKYMNKRLADAKRRQRIVAKILAAGPK